MIRLFSTFSEPENVWNKLYIQRKACRRYKQQATINSNNQRSFLNFSLTQNTFKVFLTLSGLRRNLWCTENIKEARFPIVFSLIRICMWRGERGTCFASKEIKYCRKAITVKPLYSKHLQFLKIVSAI